MIERLEPSIHELIGRIDSALAEDDAEVLALKQEVDALKQEVDALKDEASGLKQELDRLKAIEVEKHQALQEAELTLSQLHQSQQELHYYYILCQKQSEMLRQSEELQERSFALIAAVRR